MHGHLNVKYTVDVLTEQLVAILMTLKLPVVSELKGSPLHEKKPSVRPTIKPVNMHVTCVFKIYFNISLSSLSSHTKMSIHMMQSNHTFVFTMLNVLPISLLLM